MNQAPPQRCATPGCPELARAGRCSAHRRSTERAIGSAARRGYDSAWRNCVAAFRLGHDLPKDATFPARLGARNRCAMCDTNRNLQFDHIVPLRAGGPRLDPANIQALCPACHSRKTRADASMYP